MLPRRQLGSTGLEVSVLGFGASPLGGVFGPVHEGAAVECVHHAFRRGINFFDTSPYYGITKSETVLGSALRGLPRSEFVLSTKVGRYGPGTDPRDFDFSASRVTASVTESLQRLQVPYIDIIQCHDIEFGDLDQVVSETLPALASLKASGLVRHIGITGLPLGAFKYVLDRVPPGTVDVVLSYCHYCLNDTTLTKALPYLKSKGVGVITASPLCMGLLTRGGPPDWHPAPPPLRQAAAAAAEAAAARGRDIAQLGLRFAVRQPDVATTLVGMFTREMVDANVDTTLAALGLLRRQHGAAQATTGREAEKEEEAEEEQKEADTEAALAEALGILAPVRDMGWPSGRPLPAGAEGDDWGHAV